MIVGESATRTPGFAAPGKRRGCLLVGFEPLGATGREHLVLQALLRPCGQFRRPSMAGGRRPLARTPLRHKHGGNGRRAQGATYSTASHGTNALLRGRIGPLSHLRSSTEPQKEGDDGEDVVVRGTDGAAFDGVGAKRGSGGGEQAFNALGVPEVV